jgi:hypothetical protein
MACGIVRFAEIDVILAAALKRLVDWNRRPHEAFKCFSKSIDTGLKLKMMVGFTFGDGGYNGNIVTLWTNVVK